VDPRKDDLGRGDGPTVAPRDPTMLLPCPCSGRRLNLRVGGNWRRDEREKRGDHLDSGNGEAYRPRRAFRKS
jgi:hypothetical protein